MLFSVIFALRRVLCTSCVILPSAVICASRVRSYKANIISLRNEVEQYHFCKAKISRWRSRHITKTLYNSQELVFFQLYSPAASSMHFVRDMSFGRDMRFARWKLQGEYNITVSVANNITTSFASNITLTKSAYHWNSLRTVTPLQSLAIPTILCYNERSEFNQFLP